MNGFERRKERKKESIQRAALELFQTHGFKKVSIKDIAGKAGVSPVTIYNHFGSKDRLVREVVKTQLSGMMDKYRAIIDGEGSFPEKLEAIVFDKAETASRFQGELAQAAFQNDPEMMQFIDTLMQQDAVQMMIDLFEDGKREGYVNTKLSREAFLLWIELLRRGISASSDLLADIKPDTEFYRELNYLFVHGLMGKTE